MDSNIFVEKLESHKYRYCVKWDGTQEMLEDIKKDGLTFSDEDGIYYSDFEVDFENFNFGMSMCECMQRMSKDQFFFADYLRFLITHQAIDVKGLIEADEKISLYNRIRGFIDIAGMEGFLYLIAKNYDSILLEEAKKVYREADEASFIAWLKASVDPRFPTFVSPEVFSMFLIAEPLRVKYMSNLLCQFYVAYVNVCEERDEFVEWATSVKSNEGADSSIIVSSFNREGNAVEWFHIFYYFGFGVLAKHLFQMLDDGVVGLEVKRIIRDELTTHANNDPEFARQLQCLFSDYKSLSGSTLDLMFYQPEYNVESFDFPEKDVEYHLSKDLYDKDKNGFIGAIKPTYNDPKNLTCVFKELIKFRWVRPDELDTFVYRFTGQRKPAMIIDKIHWDGPIEDLLYLFKKFYAGNYGRIELFFDVKLDIAKKNYSAYADRPSPELRDLFKDLYGIKKA